MWYQQGEGTTMWEDGDMVEKRKENNLNGFGGPGWSGSLDTSYE